MRVYRGMLLVCGVLGWTAVMFHLLTGAVQTVTDVNVLPQARENGICFPVRLPFCAFTVEEQALFEGAFPEDGSGRYVVDAAALVITNHSGEFVEKGAVILRMGERVYVFEVYALPAGEKALVMEKYGSPYCAEKITACFGWSVLSEEKGAAVAVREGGMGRLCLSNPSGTVPGNIRIRYKNYDPAGNIYIGGIAYEIAVTGPAPGETVVVEPYGYLQGSSRVVSVTEEELQDMKNPPAESQPGEIFA